MRIQRITWVDEGDWEPREEGYEFLSLVWFNGESYLAIKNDVKTSPEDRDSWRPISKSPVLSADENGVIYNNGRKLIDVMALAQNVAFTPISDDIIDNLFNNGRN